MANQEIKISFKKTFKTCPNCGYVDGFHSMFERIENSNKLLWKFICPNCSKIFDLGLKTEIGE